MTDFEDEAVIYAVRYCLGRCSIGALGFLDDVSKRLGAPSHSTREVMRRDVREWLGMDERLDACGAPVGTDARRAAEGLLQALEERANNE